MLSSTEAVILLQNVRKAHHEHVSGSGCIIPSILTYAVDGAEWRASSSGLFISW
jgi:hypothetical protein